MKRIINMDNHELMELGSRMFAIWCTVYNRFEQINDAESWESADELASDFDYQINAMTGKEREHVIELKERCVSLAKGSGRHRGQQTPLIRARL